MVNYLSHFMIFYSRTRAYICKTHIYRSLYSYRAVIAWVYVGFAKEGFEFLWCEYLWVATSPCGGFGGPSPRKFRNMKCSRSDSRPILGLVRVSRLNKIFPINLRYFLYIENRLF